MGRRTAYRARRPGPRIGALGHSAGGYTVLALAGAQADLSRIAAHCASEALPPSPASAAWAAMAGRPRRPPPPPPRPHRCCMPSLRDPRVRAVVAMAPAGVAPHGRVAGPGARAHARIYEAEQDRFLVPRFHAEWIARNMPAQRRSCSASRMPRHFAFMDTPSMPIADARRRHRRRSAGLRPPVRTAGAPGAKEVPAFFDEALAEVPGAMKRAMPSPAWPSSSVARRSVQCCRILLRKSLVRGWRVLGLTEELVLRAVLEDAAADVDEDHAARRPCGRSPFRA